MDALVNAAAYGGGGVPLAQMPTEMLDRHLDVDLRAMFLTIRASLPMLTAAGAEHGKALVVNVSSLAAKGGTPGMTFYAAAKAGVNALTESAQAETRNAGIQFTIFSPGFTATPMAQWTRDAGVAPRRWCSRRTSARGCGSCCARRRRASCARSSSPRPRSGRSSSGWSPTAAARAAGE